MTVTKTWLYAGRAPRADARASVLFDCRRAAPHTGDMSDVVRRHRDGIARRIYRSRVVPSRVREVRQRLRSGRALLASISLPPTTYNEKVRYRMATDRRRILATFADRVAARDYVRERVGESILTRVYAITSSPETLSRADLPREFVLKVTHGSGGMIIVAGHAPRAQRLPRPPVGWQRLHVHPDNLDWEHLVDLSRHWLGLRYEPSEWAYSKAKPRVIIEEHLVSDGTTPPDYKFLVFDGRVRVIWVDQDQIGRA